MAAPANGFVSLIGLGFGDCGKGLFTDYLAREWLAHTVVRYNGGAQAGHNVVLPDGTHHTFSQFGAATFVAGTVTVLAHPVIVHPTALLVEHTYLQRAGVHDGLARLLIDARCRITTPFHQAAGRLRELARGSAAHGSCGVGVGETVMHALSHPQQVLRYGDLLAPARAFKILEATRRTLLAQMEQLEFAGSTWREEASALDDPTLSRRWLGRAQELARTVPPASPEQIGARLALPGSVLFEGAQGMLLDEWRGFHPHTTWSSIGPAAVEALAADYGQLSPIRHLGVMRSYLTRHGQGPLPSHDDALDILAEPHNRADGWQGIFRRGHPDAVLLDYALRSAGKIDGLLVSHLDVFERCRSLRWCHGYTGVSSAHDAMLCERSTETGLVTAIRAPTQPSLRHQEHLTALLNHARPVYGPAPIASASSFLDQLHRLTALPVIAGAFGPSHSQARMLRFP